MAQHTPQRIRSIKPGLSIWRDIDVRNFRRDLADLKRLSNQLPPASHPPLSSPDNAADSRRGYQLPFETERILADDLALIASSQPDVHGVTAAALQDRGHSSMRIHLASNGPVPVPILDNIKRIMDEVGFCAARKLSRGVCRETIFDCIVSTLRQRIHGRLQSEVWKPPAHLRANPKEPLHQVLKGSTLLDHDVRLSALELCACLRTADDHPTGSDEEYETLKRIILLCYSFSTEPAHRKFLGRASTSRRLSQIAKLARYRSCCLHLIDASRRYPELFQHTELQLHIRFSPDKTRISPGLPLTEYHVHAEIQLLMFFACDSGNDVLKPRVIGVSKSACYLCYMFFCYYGAYYLSRSHGRLYDKWTIPDILNDAALLNERDKIRGILAQMVSNTARSLLVERLRKKKVYTRWPVESGVTLSLASSESPLPSDAATIVKSPSISASIVSGMRIRSTLRLPLPSASVRDNPIESRISTTPTRNSDIANTTSTYPGLPQFKNPTELPSSRKATSHPSSNTLPALSTHSIPQAHAKSQAVSLEKSSPPLQQLPISTTSHSTVSSRTLPTTQTISPNHPWRTKYNGIHMIFELEAGNTCEEATVHLAESQASCETLHDNTFDLRKLVLGEPTLLRRASGADAIMLNLVQGGRKARTEVTLRWA